MKEMRRVTNDFVVDEGQLFFMAELPPPVSGATERKKTFTHGTVKSFKRQGDCKFALELVDSLRHVEYMKRDKLTGRWHVDWFSKESCEENVTVLIDVSSGWKRDMVRVCTGKDAKKMAYYLEEQYTLYMYDSLGVTGENDEDYSGHD